MREYLGREAVWLLQNLRRAGPLVVFRRPEPAGFRFGSDQAVWLVLFNTLLACGVSYVLSLPDPVFNIFGLANAALELTGVLLVGFIIGKFVRDDAVALRFLVLEYSVTPYFYAVWLVVGGCGQLGLVSDEFLSRAYVVSLIWGLGVSAFIILHLCGRQWRVMLPGAGAYLVLVSLPVVYVHSGDFWYGDRAGGDALVDHEGVNQEDLYYAQPALMERLGWSLAPGRAGVTDAYFVGFAGYSSEDVFMKEVRYAQRLLDERYATRGRSVALINNPHTVDRVPLATVHNLEAALGHIGRVMDRDEDVLFLYLTSHGSPEDGLAVDFWPLELNQIGPDDLKRALDASGIKWRVLLISACYSGQFVAALQDEYTLVMTAAAGDRQSFGCGVRSEFTYFGQAVFDEQLRRPQPLVEALENARRSIMAREQRERREPSLPQLFVGDAIRDKLRELDGQHPLSPVAAQLGEG